MTGCRIGKPVCLSFRTIITNGSLSRNDWVGQHSSWHNLNFYLLRNAAGTPKTASLLLGRRKKKSYCIRSKETELIKTRTSKSSGRAAAERIFLNIYSLHFPFCSFCYFCLCQRGDFLTDSCNRGPFNKHRISA